MNPLSFAYLRVSTDKQSVQNQRHQIEEYAKSRGLVVDSWFQDEETHGWVPALERKGYGNMVSLILDLGKEERPGRVLTYEISRIGRTLFETLAAIEPIEKAGVPIVSTSPKESFLQIEDSSIRNLLLSFAAFFAEREREVLVQRTNDGLARSRAEGRQAGRNVPLGYERHVCAKLGHPRCEASGRLSLNSQGRQVLDLLEADEETRGIDVKHTLELKQSEYWKAYQLLRNVRKLGDPSKPRA